MSYPIRIYATADGRHHTASQTDQSGTRTTTAKIDGAWMAMIDHQHEGHGATEAAAIADAKKSQRSSDEDDTLAADDERLMREDA